MKLSFTILLLLWAALAFAQPTIDSSKKTVAGPVAYYPQGLIFSTGPFVNGGYGLTIKTGVLMGESRIKMGFVMGYSSASFKDTMKVKNPSSPNSTVTNVNKAAVINSLSVGFISRIYFSDGKSPGVTYISPSGSFLVSTSDSRFASTNGLSLSLAMGYAAYSKTSTSVFAELGFMGMAFLTRTNERPGTFGIMLNIGVTL